MCKTGTKLRQERRFATTTRLPCGYNLHFKQEALLRKFVGSSVHACIIVLLLVICALPLAAQSAASPEQRTARYLDSVRHKPPLLLAFLEEMPKGGDLHSHLSGAVYAESLIDFAAHDGLCVDRTTSELSKPPCDCCEKVGKKPAVACAYDDQSLYNHLVDAWSMRNWKLGKESGHDHFFATFGKFGPATDSHTGDMIADVARQAAADNVSYLELMQTLDAGKAAELGKKVRWSDNLRELQKNLTENGLAEVVAAARQNLQDAENQKRSALHCDTPKLAEPGCAVEIRYLYQVTRGRAPEVVFAQMLTGFELAKDGGHVVGINLVMPEDNYIPMHDFDLHMRMLSYLHELYPNVHIALHAGELAPGLVPPEGQRFHIRESVERGHAERIGHGVDIMSESDPIQLMREMAEKNIMVEICLTSNDVILGVRGNEHPFPIYRQYGVPVALATDDEGVARSDMTQEYLRATEDYDLSYGDLKRMVRTSLEHSFLPGKSLWDDARGFRRNPACATDDPSRTELSEHCGAYLSRNERAKAQWRLEREFAAFEKKF